MKIKQYGIYKAFAKCPSSTYTVGQVINTDIVNSSKILNKLLEILPLICKIYSVYFNASKIWLSYVCSFIQLIGIHMVTFDTQR